MQTKSIPSSSIILIADSVDAHCVQIEKHLTELGFNFIATAKNGTDALAKMEIGATQASPISLLLCDWKVEGQKTLNFLKKIRSMPFSKTTTIVVVTSVNDFPNMLASASSDINGYLVRPFTPETLRDSLEAAWSTKTS